MQRNERVDLVRADVEKIAREIQQDNIYFELESQQFIKMVLGLLDSLRQFSDLTENRLAPLKILLQARIKALANTPGNFHCNEGGAANLVTMLISAKFAPLVGDKHPDWLFKPDPYLNPEQFGLSEPTENCDKIASLIMKRCFESSERHITNAVKLAELLQTLPKARWTEFFDVFKNEDLDLTRQLCNGFLQVPIDTYMRWDKKKELMSDRLNEALADVAKNPETARIYFFLFCELYYRLRQQEPEFKSQAGAVFANLNVFGKVVSTKEDKLKACRMLQQFLTSKSFGSLGDNIQLYFERHQAANLFAETEKDCLGLLTQAIANCAKVILEHRKQAQSRPF